LSFDPLKAAKEIQSLFEGFIGLAKQVKAYLTPQYQEASTALYLVTKFVYEDNQKILQWMVDFENLDLSEEKKALFLEFKKKLDSFKISPDYTNFRGHCHDIGRIYDFYLEKPLKKWSGDIFLQAKNIFDKLRFADDSIAGLAQHIFGEVEKATRKVSADYPNANNIQKDFIDNIQQHKQRIMKETDELNILRNDFFDLAGKPVSINLSY
jgi:hypothetical protein